MIIDFNRGRKGRQTEHLPLAAINVGNRLRQPTPEAVNRLADSIRQIGLRLPITVRPNRNPDDNGKKDYQLTTGATRLAAVKAMGGNPEEVTIECFVEDVDEVTAKMWEIAENLHRSELTALERDEQIALWIELLEQRQVDQVGPVAKKPRGGNPKGGLREASRDLGIPRATVQRAVKVAALSSEAKAAAREAGLDNNQSALLDAAQQLTPKDQVAALRMRETEANIRKAASQIKHEKKVVRLEARRRETAALAAFASATGRRFDLYNESCENVLKREPNSVDWIITDPPYPREFLPLYDLLAEISEHALKPGGSLLAMSGQSYLPDVMARLGTRLKWNWGLAYMTPGPATLIPPRNVNSNWKPVLWFTKGDYCGGLVGDVAQSPHRDKNAHVWGQSESGMRDLMRRFVKPGDVVLDPFMGAGTTGVIALELGARFIGYDIDPVAFNEAKVRVNLNPDDLAVAS